MKKIKYYSLISLMVLYIGWVFYMSEPTYINSCNRLPVKYDYITLTEWVWSFKNSQEVIVGIILQTDDSTILIKTKSFRDKFYEIPINSSDYRIVGSGTFYHKVNDYLGFNIMLITQIFIAILVCILIRKLII